MIVRVFENEFGGFEESAVHFVTLFTLWLVKDGLSEVNQFHFLGIILIENVVGFDISMNYSLRVNEVKILQK